MIVPLFSKLVQLIEEIFTAHHAEEIAKAAESAAVGAAVANVEQDPKVAAVTAASVALLTAARNLKATMEEHPEAAAAAPVKTSDQAS